MKNKLRYILLACGVFLGGYAAAFIEANIRAMEGVEQNPLVLLFALRLSVLIVVPALVIELIRSAKLKYDIKPVYMLLIGASYIPFAICLHFLRYGTLSELPYSLSIPGLVFNPITIYGIYYVLSVKRITSDYD